MEKDTAPQDAQSSSPPDDNSPDDALVERHGKAQDGTGKPSGQDQIDDMPAGQNKQKTASRIKQLWAKTGIDMMTVILAFKASLAPTLAIAVYQAHSFAAHYTTLGYLVAIASVLGMAVMPRGKFLQTMALNILAICFAAAINLLALFCVTQARLHTTPPGHPPTGYNSSASAVAAVWLCFFVYCISVLRAARPQLMFPAILTSIFCIVSMSYGVEFPNMTAVISFIKKLLEAFLTGFAFSTGVHFFIFPTSSRKVVMKEMTGYFQLLNGLLKLETAFMASIEDANVVELRRKLEADAKDLVKNRKKKPAPKSALTSTPASVKLKEMLAKLLDLHTKLSGDITPAKREFAIGKLESHDLTELWRLLRLIFVPVMGISTVIDILERQAEVYGWADVSEDEMTAEKREERDRIVEAIQMVMKHLHDPFKTMTHILDGAFQHALIILELVKPPKKKKDEENRGDEPVPGSPEFLEDFKKKVDNFYASKEKTLRELFHERGINLPANFFESDFVPPDDLYLASGVERERRQRQLFFLLYLEHLLWRVAASVLDLILYVEKRRTEGVFKRSKLIFPGSKSMAKWVRAVFGREDMAEEDNFSGDLDASGARNLYLGQEFSKRRDPEHLPPSNALEKFGEHLRAIPRFFRSDASAFGLRVVAATMTIAIVDYLQASQTWFLKQRLLWAEIMVAISMNRMAGQSMFNFACRILGTAVAAVASYVIWYIVDGKVPGVIVFLWLWLMFAFGWAIKHPKFMIVGILGLVTSILIVGYELQVKTIGKQASESNGQPAYPLYILAPYRLAAVAGGLFVAFIWTVFPFPISETAEVRKDLGASLYLLSNYYSIVHETVVARVNGTIGDSKVKGSHAHHLEKARNQVFAKLLLLLNNLATNSSFGKFQLRFGGKFPRTEYDELISCCQRLVQWTTLIVYTSRSFDHTQGFESTRWQRDFHRLFAKINVTSHEVTSLLALLSSSLTSGQPLPPYINPPSAFDLTERLNAIDTDILNARHIIEPEYSAFAVLQAAAHYINTDIVKVKKHVTTLVGEMDFSFHAVKSSSATTNSSSLDMEKEDSKES